MVRLGQDKDVATNQATYSLAAIAVLPEGQAAASGTGVASGGPLGLVRNVVTPIDQQSWQVMSKLHSMGFILSV